MKKSAKLPSGLGRPRTRPAGESTILSFKVEDDLVRALDEEAKAMSAEQVSGRASITRGELVRILLHEGLAAHAKARTAKPRA
jgi:predicted transcriptional regulator